MFFGIGSNQSTKPKVTKHICLLIRVTLKILNKSNLMVDVNHENEFDENGDLISQRTKIELKEK